MTSDQKLVLRRTFVREHLGAENCISNDATDANRCI